MRSRYDSWADRLRAMKWKILALSLILLLIVFMVNNELGERREVIRISGAYALYPMMTIWIEEYQKVNPDVVIDISGGGAGKGMVDALTRMSDIGMVSRDIYPVEVEQGAFYIAVCKDAVVPTINSRNPVIDQLREQGVTRAEFEDIFITGRMETWGQLVGDPTNTNRIRVYTRADSCGAAYSWAAYLGDYTQSDLTGEHTTGINFDPGLADAVINDIHGIGYNNINFVYDMRTGLPLDGLAVVPIDLDENGRLDPWEDFYHTRDDMLEGISAGHYPSPPARELYLVTRDEFSGPSRDFVIWILTEGQLYVGQGGYVPLSTETIDEQLIKLGHPAGGPS